MNLNIRKLGPKFQQAAELGAEHLGLLLTEDGMEVEVNLTGTGIEVLTNKDGASINIAKDQYFMRALGLLVEYLKMGDREINLKESPSQDSLELILAPSKGAILNLKAYKEFLLCAALMGYTSLHMDRTSGYSQEELKEMVGYAESLFMELVPLAKGKASEGEGSVFTALPALQKGAELCYRENDETSHLSKRFKTCTQGNYDDFLKLDLRSSSAVDRPEHILNQDILTTAFDKTFDKVAATLHFQKCSREFERIIKNQPSKWNDLFESQQALCDILSIKSHSGVNIEQAYKEGNKERLKQYGSLFLPELIEKFELFILAYRKQWMKENKCYGLDLFDLHMGGLVQRVKTAKLVIDQYLENEISSIEELD